MRGRERFARVERERGRARLDGARAGDDLDPVEERRLRGDGDGRGSGLDARGDGADRDEHVLGEPVAAAFELQVDGVGEVASVARAESDARDGVPILRGLAHGRGERLRRAPGQDEGRKRASDRVSARVAKEALRDVAPPDDAPREGDGEERLVGAALQRR